MRATTSFFGVLLGVALLGPVPVAFAQGAGSQAEAQALFDAARKLMDQGRYGEACPKLEASQKLDPGAGTLLNLASCYEKNNQTASAWVTYQDAASASQSSGHPDWAAKANTKVAALQPHLSKVTITMANPPDGVTIKRDGKPVSYASLGTELPMDPGNHTLEVSAPNKTTWTSTFSVKAESAQAVKIPDLEDAPKTTGGGDTTPTPTTKGGGGGQKIVGLVLAGAGVVAIGIGSGLGIDAASKKGVADDPTKCGRTADGKLHCNSAGIDQLDSANASATISTVLFVAGGALIAGGIVVFLAAPKAAAAETKTGIRVSPTLGGLVIDGRF